MGTSVSIGDVCTESPEENVLLLVRTSVSGLRRFCSIYLLSAFLVLLGGALALYQEPNAPHWEELSNVFFSQLLYELLLVLVLAYLHRRRSSEPACREEVLLLLTVLS